MQINGVDPAIIRVGDTYTDLGATITGPTQDLNLGIQLFLDGVAVLSIQLDTSAAATDTIAYVVTDQNGLTSTSGRTVIIEAANNNTSAPANDNVPTTTSSATSTSS